MKVRLDCPMADIDWDAGELYCKLYPQRCHPAPSEWKPFSCDRILDTSAEAWTPVRSGHGSLIYLGRNDDD